VRLRVVGNREQLVAMMEAGEVDLTVMGRPPKEMATRAEAFAAHPLVFVCPPGHPLSKIGHAGVRRRLCLHRARTGPHAHGDESSSPTRRATHHDDVEQRDHQTAGMGLSFRRCTPWPEVRSGLLQVLDVVGTPVMRTWNVVHLQSKLLSPAAEAFRYY
jgi:DNA-binding transcriptional LysR family regulator